VRTTRAVLLDVDGTLVDSNDAHAQAWVEAFAERGIAVDYAKVRRSIGMGGDKLMPAVSHLTEDSPEGQCVSTRRRELFKQRFLPELRALRGSRELVAALRERGYTTVAASSAKEDELGPLLAVAGAESLLDGATSSDDADESKPDPDIVHAALRRAKARPEEAVMIGDTPYDIESASRAGVRAIALRTGGWSDAELAGAAAVYDDPADLLANLDRSPLAW
jgi:HAD superfamily hydrolase (TIGR01509 family)